MLSFKEFIIQATNRPLCSVADLRFQKSFLYVLIVKLKFAVVYIDPIQSSFLLFCSAKCGRLPDPYCLILLPLCLKWMVQTSQKPSNSKCKLACCIRIPSIITFSFRYQNTVNATHSTKDSAALK